LTDNLGFDDRAGSIFINELRTRDAAGVWCPSRM
jgi:hypothetical protein